MKKLKLKALDLSAKELLSREQMKMISGGAGSGSGIRTCDGDYGYMPACCYVDSSCRIDSDGYCCKP